MNAHSVYQILPTAKHINVRFSDSVIKLTLTADIVDDRIVFAGGRKGTHSLSLGDTDLERFHAHWQGYEDAQAAATLPHGVVNRYNNEEIAQGSLKNIDYDLIAIELQIEASELRPELY
jgi:hypothetical protein